MRSSRKGVSMGRGQKVTLDSRAVSHVLAVRAMLLTTSGKSPSDRTTAGAYRMKGYGIGRSSLQRNVKGDTAPFESFEQEAA